MTIRRALPEDLPRLHALELAILRDGRGQVTTAEAADDVGAYARRIERYFGSPDAALLVSLLPHLVHVRGEPRLATLVRLVVEESRERRPARDVILWAIAAPRVTEQTARGTVGYTVRVPVEASVAARITARANRKGRSVMTCSPSGGASAGW